MGEKEAYFRRRGRTIPLVIFSLALDTLFYMVYLLAEPKVRVKCVARQLFIKHVMDSGFGLQKPDGLKFSVTFFSPSM